MKGVYSLIIQVSEPATINIGALGQVCFKKGLYAYVGSAQNNLELRIQRHLRKDKVLFWHIDYLLDNPVAKVVDVLYKDGEKSEECRMADFLLRSGCEPILKFGSSDCNCKSHLFLGESFDFLREKMKLTIYKKKIVRSLQIKQMNHPADL